VLTGESGGVLYLTANGGTSQDGTGGAGGSAQWSAETMKLAQLIAQVNGGASQNDDGGSGGAAGMEVQFATDVYLSVAASGGNGGDQGGRGGDYYFHTEDNSTAATTWTRVTIDADVNGGNGGNTGVGAPAGGTAGSGFIGNYRDTGSNVGTITGTDVNVYMNGRGGNGSFGSNGGQLDVVHVGGGTLNIALRDSNFSGGHANGNAGSVFIGGRGGEVEMTLDQNSILNLHFVNFVGHGGNSFSNDDAGRAAFLTASMDDDADGAGGTLNLTGNMTGTGGSAPGNGAAGRGMQITTYDTGSGSSGSHVSLDLQFNSTGGDSVGDEAGNGGLLYIGSSGDLTLAGTFNMTGGAGATDGAGGGADVYILGDLTIGAAITSRGGGTTGDGGTMTLGGDTAATVAVTAAASVRTLGAAPAGSAGSIFLNPTGTGPGNPNLDVETGAVVQAIDGDGTDVSATNVTED
jgi:hypothetical protein